MRRYCGPRRRAICLGGCWVRPPARQRPGSAASAWFVCYNIRDLSACRRRRKGMGAVSAKRGQGSPHTCREPTPSRPEARRGRSWVRHQLGVGTPRCGQGSHRRGWARRQLPAGRAGRGEGSLAGRVGVSAQRQACLVGGAGECLRPAEPAARFRCAGRASCSGEGHGEGCPRSTSRRGTVTRAEDIERRGRRVRLKARPVRAFLVPLATKGLYTRGGSPYMHPS